jgi:Do/DeqQ family serine protease
MLGARSIVQICVASKANAIRVKLPEYILFIHGELFMRFQHYKKIALVSVVFASLGTFSACQWASPGKSPSAKNEKKATKPPAPVVVDGTRTSYADIVEKTSPAVVQITSVLKAEPSNLNGDPHQGPQFGPRRNDLPQRPQRGAGSGVIVSEDGTILTNHHVIDGAQRITVETSDNKVHEAEVVGSDKPSDLAVIRIKGDKYPFLELGDSDEVRVGDIVLAIGNPLGIGQSVTSGIISAKGRTTGIGDGTSSYQDFLQTDAPINQGNSGGPLVNVKGEIVGINSQILSRSGGSIGIGFAIPSNMAKTVMEQLVKTGKVRRGLLGVNIQNVSLGIAEQYGLKDATGVIVSNLKKDGAAEKAGIKRGDIIIKIDGDSVSDGNVLRNKVAGTMPGEEVTLTVLRDKQEKTIKVKLDEFEIAQQNETEGPAGAPDSAAPKQNGRLGVSVQPVTPELASRFRLPSGTKGIAITSVDPNGPAAEAGINPGDVILEVNRETVESIDDMRSAIEKSGDGGAIVLLLSRGGQTLFVAVRQQ